MLPSIRSFRPSICGWKAVDIVCLIVGSYTTVPKTLRQTVVPSPRQWLLDVHEDAPPSIETTWSTQKHLSSYETEQNVASSTANPLPSKLHRTHLVPVIPLWNPLKSHLMNSPALTMFGRLRTLYDVNSDTFDSYNNFTHSDPPLSISPSSNTVSPEGQRFSPVQHVLLQQCHGVPESTVTIPVHLFEHPASLDTISALHALCIELHQQNVIRSRSHTQTSQTLRVPSAVLLSTSRCSQPPLELCKVLSDSARAFSDAPESTCSDEGALRMLRDLMIRIIKIWLCWNLCASLRETSRAAETSAQALRETWCRILTPVVVRVP